MRPAGLATLSHERAERPHRLSGIAVGRGASARIVMILEAPPDS
jgi:hypothetical protein